MIADNELTPSLENAGTILANLKFCGMIPAERDLFIRMVKTGVMIYSWRSLLYME